MSIYIYIYTYAQMFVKVSEAAFHIAAMMYYFARKEVGTG